MGGQVGDSGWLIDENGEKTDIFDTKRENNLRSSGSRLPQQIEGSFLAKIDTAKRTATGM